MKQLLMTAVALFLGVGAAFAQDEAEFKRKMEELRRNHERAMQEMNKKFQAERENLDKEFRARMEQKERPAPVPECGRNCPGCPRPDCPRRCPPGDCPRAPREGNRPSMDRENPMLCLGRAIQRLCALLERLEQRMGGFQGRTPRLDREGSDLRQLPRGQMRKRLQGGEGPQSAPRREQRRDRRGF